MPSSLKHFRTRALKRPAVRKAYDDLEEEFALVDEVRKLPTLVSRALDAEFDIDSPKAWGVRLCAWRSIEDPLNAAR